MNPILNHWYEFTDGSVSKCELLSECPPDEIARDLTIGPDAPIQAADMGRLAMRADGECAPITKWDHAGCRWHVCTRQGWYDADGASCVDAPRLTRFLSARECDERDLEPTHPTQIASARAPGVFKVGDRVCHLMLTTHVGVVTQALAKRPDEGNDTLVLWERGDGHKEQCLTHSVNLELIEPAREGEGAASSTAALNRGSDPATLPPAPPASDFERLFGFFRDKRPAAVPFALGQKVEVAVKQE